MKKALACMVAVFLATWLNGCGEQRRLRLPGFVQFFSRALLSERPEIITQGVRRFTESLFDNRVASR
jgi:hypothetical protein